MPPMNDDCRPLSEVEFVAIDLETTGLSPVACQIVEVGAIRFRLDGQELGCVDQLVDPRCPIPAAVTRIHGITDAMVRGKPTLDGLLPEFQRILGGPETILLAHNARFDLGFLSCAMARLGAPLPVQPVIDTLRLSRTCLRGLFSHRLETVAIHLQLADREDHRALSDSRLVMGLFQRIVADTPRLQTVDDLFRISPPIGFQRTAVPIAKPSVEGEKLRMAIQETRTITMVYEGKTTGVVERKVTPRALVRYGDRPCLLAFCHLDGIEKTYRLDRIRQIRVEE